MTTDTTEPMRDALMADLYSRLPKDRPATMVDIYMAVDRALATVGYQALADYVVATETTLTAFGAVLTAYGAEVPEPPPELTTALGDYTTTEAAIATARADFNAINALLLP
jgi:hypothetical protein